MDQFERVNLEEKKQFKTKRFQNKNNYDNKKNNNNRFRNNRDQQFKKRRQNNWKQNDDQNQQQRNYKQKERRVIVTGQKRREQKKRNFQSNNQRYLQPNVIIKGLDSQITDANLQKACKDFGPMEMCKLDRDNFGQVKPEGIGLVRFTSTEDALQCVQRLDGATVKLFGEDSGEKVISASFVGDKNEDQRKRGVLQITKGPIKKREWRR